MATKQLKQKAKVGRPKSPTSLDQVILKAVSDGTSTQRKYLAQDITDDILTSQHTRKLIEAAVLKQLNA